MGKRVCNLVGLLALLVAMFAGVRVAAADTGDCPSREDIITIVAHKADVQYSGVLSKEVIWRIGERESGLRHCNLFGFVKISPTNDHGTFQLNPAGVWRNCRVNQYCDQPGMIDDVEAQVDLIINYYRTYRDLCPWNPNHTNPNYMPGCGYQGE